MSGKNRDKNRDKPLTAHRALAGFLAQSVGNRQRWAPEREVLRLEAELDEQGEAKDSHAEDDSSAPRAP